jgi:hypothetical protein
LWIEASCWTGQKTRLNGILKTVEQEEAKAWEDGKDIEIMT